MRGGEGPSKARSSQQDSTSRHSRGSDGETLAIAGKRERDLPQAGLNPLARGLEVRSQSAGQMHKHHPLDRTLGEKSGQWLDLEMSQLANQQVHWLSEQRRQILDRPQVSRVRHPQTVPLQQKTECLERLGVLRLESRPEPVQMRGQIGRHLHTPARHRMPSTDRLEPQAEGQQIRKHAPGLEHPLDRHDSLLGHVHRQGSPPRLQPETLHQHEQPPEWSKCRCDRKTRSIRS